MVYRRKLLKFLPASILALTLAAGLSWPRNASADPAITVVATTSMIADAARQVGGERVAVQALMGPGVDPHAYRQTRSDIAAMLRADAVLWHGLYLEAQLEEFLLELGDRKRVFAVGEAAPRDRLIAHDDYSNKVDPHIWMDPSLWRSVVVAVRDALSEIDPDGTATYAAGAERHLAEVDRLNAYAVERLASVPAEQRVLVTAHDAFNYFGRAFDFEVMGIQGISTESEAGLRRIEELVDTLVSRGITAVFVESSVSDRNVQALIEGAAARGHTVRIGGELFSDAMGPSGTYEGTYIGMIDHNVTGITRALGGDAPAQGMQGRLAAGI
ncbi:metal ABC transporter solute-binding protein, Zn/Mn family [Thalassobaculum sp.]|uniref:metal ABC transporter solute-binding protein, Zn/Mn family n=1 Tax=Thalassobaculum sp. TaxID=2022740 RepID=UPI003B5C2F29